MTTTNKTDTLTWARARHAELQAKSDACQRIGTSLLDAYGAGQRPAYNDFAQALVRVLALAADLVNLTRQVVEACHDEA
jgi:hypothetical protein